MHHHEHQSCGQGASQGVTREADLGCGGGGKMLTDERNELLVHILGCAVHTPAVQYAYVCNHVRPSLSLTPWADAAHSSFYHTCAP